MSTDILMVSKSFKGEAKRHGLENAIEVLSVSFGAVRPTGSADRPTATTAFSSIALSAPMDSGVAQLMAIAVVGSPMTEVAIKQFRSGGNDDVLIWSLTMKDVLIESFSLSGGDPGRLPTVHMALSYGAGSILYMPQSTTGIAVNPVMFDFDLTQNIA